MANSQVAQDTATEIGGSTNMTLSFTGVSVDDVVLIAATSDGQGLGGAITHGTDVTSGAGPQTSLTEDQQLTNTDGRDIVCSVWYGRVAAADLTAGQLDVDLTRSAEQDTSVCGIVFSGLTDTGALLDAVTTSLSVENLASSTNPAIDTATDGSLVVLVLHGSHDNIVDSPTAPSGYTLGPVVVGSGLAADHGQTEIAYLLDAGVAGTETPGVWGNGIGTVQDNQMFTLAFRTQTASGVNLAASLVDSATVTGSAAKVSELAASLVESATVTGDATGGATSLTASLVESAATAGAASKVSELAAALVDSASASSAASKTSDMGLSAVESASVVGAAAKVSELIVSLIEAGSALAVASKISELAASLVESATASATITVEIGELGSTLQVLGLERASSAELAEWF